MRKVKCESCVELGTCLGISAAYQAAALELNGVGRIITLEGAPLFGAIASGTIAGLGLSHRAEVKVGRFSDNLPGVLAGFGRIDYAFIDGHHDENATVGYFEQIVPYAVDTAVIVFDDIAWSDGMRRAWRRVSRDSRVAIALDLDHVGVCILGAGVKARCKIFIA